MAFTWIPEFGGEKQPKTKKIVCQFDDGYIQEQPVGMNSFSADHRLTFLYRDDAEADAIEAFLTTNDCLSFEWTPTGEATAKRFRCNSADWKRVKVKNNVNTITAKFTQVFEP